VFFLNLFFFFQKLFYSFLKFVIEYFGISDCLLLLLDVFFEFVDNLFLMFELIDHDGQLFLFCLELFVVIGDS